MTFDGTDNTLALPDHADHIHVGFHPLYGDERQARPAGSARSSSPAQWTKLIDRLGADRQPDRPRRAVEVRAIERQAGARARGDPGRLRPAAAVPPASASSRSSCPGPSARPTAATSCAATRASPTTCSSLAHAGRAAAPPRLRRAGAAAARARAGPGGGDDVAGDGHRAPSRSPATRPPSAGCRRPTSRPRRAAALVVLERVAARPPRRRPPTRARAGARARPRAGRPASGYGAGEQVAEGRWTRAVELPAPPAAERRRAPAAPLRPQERLAALLGGRDAALACELLALRARADLDAGRLREAALAARAPPSRPRLAELEPWRDRGDLAPRLDELAALREDGRGGGRRRAVGAASTTTRPRRGRALGRLEAALRARSAARLRVGPAAPGAAGRRSARGWRGDRVPSTTA